MTKAVSQMVEAALRKINRCTWAMRAGGLEFTVHRRKVSKEILVRFFGTVKLNADKAKEAQVKQYLAAAAQQHRLPFAQNDFSPVGQLSLWAAHVKREKVVALMKEQAGSVEFRKPHTWVWKIKRTPARSPKTRHS